VPLYRALPVLSLAALLTASTLLAYRMHKERVFPYPPFNELIFNISEKFQNLPSFSRPLGSEGGFRDFGGLLLGLRRLTADIAWLSVLQYYGSHEAAGHEEDHESRQAFGAGRYAALKDMVMRTVRLDPHFHFAYLYGAGSLAFNLDRYDEALELLQDGIQRNPNYWKFRLYVAAIVWKKKGEYDNMIPLLEEAIAYPDCPTLVKSSLANIHKARKNYARALQIWLNVLETEHSDAVYRQQAEDQIGQLRGLLGL